MLGLRSVLVVAVASFTSTGCALGSDGNEADTAAGEDALRTAEIALTVDAAGNCKATTPLPRVKFNRVVRLRNVGDKPLAALVELWDNFGGMPAPEGGDIAPGKFVSVKMSTRWWVLEDDSESRDWSTPVVCKRGPWADDQIDFDEVGSVQVFR